MITVNEAQRQKQIQDLEDLQFSMLDEDIKKVFEPLKGGRYKQDQPIMMQICRDLHKLVLFKENKNG